MKCIQSSHGARSDNKHSSLIRSASCEGFPTLSNGVSVWITNCTLPKRLMRKIPDDEADADDNGDSINMDQTADHSYHDYYCTAGKLS